jgi:hypothetical protein
MRVGVFVGQYGIALRATRCGYHKDGVLVFRSSWTHGPELAQVLNDLHAWEKAQVRNELVRVCYSERLVGLLRNKKISASVHRRAGPKATRDFDRLLDAEGKIG